jgi:hypothetical protein
LPRIAHGEMQAASADRASDRFSSGAAAPWSSVKVWGRADFKGDHALEGGRRGSEAVGAGSA